jgi:hypothetical protein
MPSWLNPDWPGVWHWLTAHIEAASWTEIGLLLVAVVAAVGAYARVSAIKLFELVKYLEYEHFRNARRVEVQDIARKLGTEWWHDATLEAAASACAGHYDEVASLVRFSCGRRLRKFIIRRWAESIVRVHGVLEPYMQHRKQSGGNDYHDFEWLYANARHYRKTVGAPWP